MTLHQKAKPWNRKQAILTFIQKFKIPFEMKEDAIDLLSSAASDADLLAMFPAPVIARIRNALLNQVKSEQKIPVQKAAPTQQREKRRYKTMSEIFD